MHRQRVLAGWVTRILYLCMVQYWLKLQLNEKFKENLIFQQDHNALTIFLNEKLPRLIDYGCPNAWPPRSHVLTPVDFFLLDSRQYLCPAFVNKSSGNQKQDSSRCGVLWHMYLTQSTKHQNVSRVRGGGGNLMLVACRMIKIFLSYCNICCCVI